MPASSKPKPGSPARSASLDMLALMRLSKQAGGFQPAKQNGSRTMASKVWSVNEIQDAC